MLFQIFSVIRKKNLEYKDLVNIVLFFKGKVDIKNFNSSIDGEIIFHDNEKFTIYINGKKNSKEVLAVLIGHLFLHINFFEEVPVDWKEKYFIKKTEEYFLKKKEAVFLGIELLVNTELFFSEEKQKINFKNLRKEN